MKSLGILKYLIQNFKYSIVDYNIMSHNNIKPSRIIPKYAANSQPFTVLIEGNIGSGKTTFLNHFRQFEDKVCLLTEPVDKWRNLNGVNLLDKMYKEPEKWSMPFQSYVTLTMLEAHTKQTNKAVKLMERSIYSARYCFVENMFKNGIMEDGMYNVLQEWFKFIDQSVHVRADLIVYLRTSPDVAYQRIHKRGRSEEECLNEKTLKQLHQLHEDWLIHRINNFSGNVVVLDANLDLDNITQEYKRFEDRIINPAYAEQQQTIQAVTVSPSKRGLFE